ncbi:MAG: hypothetical protein V1856_03305 [Candidatus Liptonbacteria bacterium]
MSEPKIDMEKLMQKVAEMKKSGTADLSTEEDLSIAIMNLISLEEHFFFSAEKTGKEDYFDMLSEVREMRKSLLARMMDKNEGESWCISKHLLAASMRIMEVGTKLQSDGKKEDAQEMFKKAYETYSMFWALRLKVIDPAGFKKMAASEKPWTYQDIVNKLVDCCDE